jgi:hypothetical protein
MDIHEDIHEQSHLSPPPRPHLTARWLLWNCPGLMYLTWVAVTTVGVVHSLISWDQPDAGLSGIANCFQTLPWSLFAVVTPALPGPLGLIVLITVLTAGAVANAVVLNWTCRCLVEAIRRGAELPKHGRRRLSGRPRPLAP